MARQSGKNLTLGNRYPRAAVKLGQGTDELLAEVNFPHRAVKRTKRFSAILKLSSEIFFKGKGAEHERKTI